MEYWVLAGSFSQCLRWVPKPIFLIQNIYTMPQGHFMLRNEGLNNLRGTRGGELLLGNHMNPLSRRVLRIQLRYNTPVQDKKVVNNTNK